MNLEQFQKVIVHMTIVRYFDNEKEVMNEEEIAGKPTKKEITNYLKEKNLIYLMHRTEEVAYTVETSKLVEALEKIHNKE